MAKEKRQKSRAELDPRTLWKIEAMYADDDAWEADFRQAGTLAEEFPALAGTLGRSSGSLLAAFAARDALWQKVERVYVYARMKKDEDTRNGRYQAMSDRAQSLAARAGTSAAFFVPELLRIPEETIDAYLTASSALNVYRHAIRQIQREKAHVLSEPEEALIARYSELTQATNDIFSMINNADMKFGTITDEDGDAVELTHGSYSRHMESQDRRVRKEAFDAMYTAFEARKNTLAATYNYNTKTDAVVAGIRKYRSSLEAALAGDDIPVAVYDNLVASVRKWLPSLHRYVELRRKALRLDAVHMYDIYAPLVQQPAGEIPYEEAVRLVREGLAPLGETYGRDLQAGIEAGWIDVYESEGKTSGAYSFGSYDSMPFVLLNYQGRLKDVFTVAHELGHSMHSYYTRRTQPFVYGGHSIFTAEVASTVNENLLMHHLLEKEIDPDRRRYLLNLYIEEFRGTVFRQTMFAEFERFTHGMVEKGGSLTADQLCEAYFDLNRTYFGDRMVCDPAIAYEWARIPHFYNAFYVYKYATGYSAAVALSERILREGAPARDDYLAFLASGESDDPIPLLRKAGVDMADPAPVDTALAVFDRLVGELEASIG